MRIKINRRVYIRKSDALFMLAMVTYIFFRMLALSCYMYIVPGKVFELINIFVLIILLVKNLKKIMFLKIKFYIFIPSLILVGFVGITSESGLTLILFILLIFSAYDVDFSLIIRGMILSYILTICFVCGSTVLGIIPNNKIIHKGNTASCFGFLYYTTFPNIIMVMSICILWLKREKKRLMRLLFFVMVNYICYRFCTSLHSFLSFIFFALLYFLKDWVIHWNFRNRISRIIGTMWFPGCLGLSLYACVYYYYNPLSRELLDEIFSYRIMLMSNSYFENGIHLLGNPIKMTTEKEIYNYVDSGYMYMLLVFGVLFTVIIILAYTWLLYTMSKRGEDFIYIWLITIGLYAISNRILLNLQYNPVLYLVPQLIMERYYILRSTKRKILNV